MCIKNINTKRGLRWVQLRAFHAFCKSNISIVFWFWIGENTSLTNCRGVLNEDLFFTQATSATQLTFSNSTSSCGPCSQRLQAESLMKTVLCTALRRFARVTGEEGDNGDERRFGADDSTELLIRGLSLACVQRSWVRASSVAPPSSTFHFFDYFWCQLISIVGWFFFVATSVRCTSISASRWSLWSWLVSFCRPAAAARCYGAIRESRQVV